MPRAPNSSNPQPDRQPPATPGISFIRYFLLGLGLTGLPIFIYLSMSLSMTHTSLGDVGSLKLGLAIAIPLSFGLLSGIFKQRVTQVLAALLESPTLPF